MLNRRFEESKNGVIAHDIVKFKLPLGLIGRIFGSSLVKFQLKKIFEFRKNKVIQSMKEKNLDALLLFRQESMYWLTGYDTFGYVFFQCLILEKSGNIILLTRAPDLRPVSYTHLTLPTNREV